MRKVVTSDGIALIGCYVTQIHDLVEHERRERALSLMYTHHVIVISLNYITVSFNLLRHGEVAMWLLRLNLCLPRFRRNGIRVLCRDALQNHLRDGRIRLCKLQQDLFGSSVVHVFGQLLQYNVLRCLFLHRLQSVLRQRIQHGCLMLARVTFTGVWAAALHPRNLSGTDLHADKIVFAALNHSGDLIIGLLYETINVLFKPILLTALQNVRREQRFQVKQFQID